MGVETEGVTDGIWAIVLWEEKLRETRGLRVSWVWASFKKF